MLITCLIFWSIFKAISLIFFLLLGKGKIGIYGGEKDSEDQDFCT